MMNENDIRTLVAHFMEGETTPQEERSLYEAFRSGDVPSDLAELRQMFVDLGEMLDPIDALQREALPSEAKERTPRSRRHLLHWVAGIAAAALLTLVGTWMFTAQDDAIDCLPNDLRAGRLVSDSCDEAKMRLLLTLLAPTAEDTLRQNIDCDIDRKLAMSGCTADDFLCYFYSHSQLIETNRDPQYVNNVLGRMLSLCRRNGELRANAMERQQCIDTLQALSSELLADTQHANNLGMGLCLQCIRALGGVV